MADLLHAAETFLPMPFSCLCSKTAMAAMEVLQQMTNVSSERGGQSGGLVTLLHSGTSVSGLRVRVMPGKRQNLAQKVSCQLRSSLTGRSPG